MRDRLAGFLAMLSYHRDMIFFITIIIVCVSVILLQVENSHLK